MNKINLINITKEYEKKLVLSGINLQIKEPKTIAIIGKSGSGKTTLLNIIGGIDLEYTGTIKVNDTFELNKKNQNIYLREKVSFILQNFGLVVDKDINYNLDIGLKYRKDLNKVQKEELKIKTLKSMGINYELKTPILQLSGGEQQRIAIARAILKKSDIILADEPTGSLDETSAQEIINILKKLNKVVIIVTHNLTVANSCDVIYKLQDTKLVRQKDSLNSEVY
ncbi:MAG: ATP-binding cassette domain-containing protein [Mycoplasmatales bacterium]